MKLGERVILRVAEIVENSNFDEEKENQIFELIKPFIKYTEDIDLMTICKLELITGKKILTIPTKQEWRKIKIEKLNEICNKK